MDEVTQPPIGDPLLAAQGELREAVASPASLRSIDRRASSTTTAEIIADLRHRPSP